MDIVYSTEVTVQVPDPIAVRYSLAAKKEERNQIWYSFCKTAYFWHQSSCFVLILADFTFFEIFQLFQSFQLNSRFFVNFKLFRDFSTPSRQIRPD